MNREIYVKEALTLTVCHIIFTLLSLLFLLQLAGLYDKSDGLIIILLIIFGFVAYGSVSPIALRLYLPKYLERKGRSVLRKGKTVHLHILELLILGLGLNWRIILLGITTLPIRSFFDIRIFPPHHNIAPVVLWLVTEYKRSTTSCSLMSSQLSLIP